MELRLVPGNLTLADLRMALMNPIRLMLDESAVEAIEASRQVVADVIARNETVYAINTGFGKLANTRINPDQLDQLQENLVLSHAVGTGPMLGDGIVRLILLLKINALAQGYSGVRVEIVEALAKLLNAGVYPCIPAQGSVGASGDLAPLAHMAAPLIGHGELRYKGEVMPALKGLKKAGLKPLKLGPKEGLALLNGTQVSTALALAGLFGAENCFAALVVAGSMTIDAAKGSPAPFRPEIQRIRRQKGQIEVAGIYRELLEGSEIRDSHHDCEKVQDPYSLRCQPQVMGACLDHMRFAARVLEREANAVTDNPLIFSDTGEALSGGNFHAEPVAMVADQLALAIAEMGALSERRTAMLIDPVMSGLPIFLTTSNPGVNSGYMIAQVTAAALASENKQLSHPACVDSIPTNANQEDHVSMATHGARRLLHMVDNTAGIAGIELLCAAQGIEFHRPLKSSDFIEQVIKLIRLEVPRLEEDRYMAPDIERAKSMVSQGQFLAMLKIGVVSG